MLKGKVVGILGHNKSSKYKENCVGEGPFSGKSQKLENRNPKVLLLVAEVGSHLSQVRNFCEFSFELLCIIHTHTTCKDKEETSAPKSRSFWIVFSRFFHETGLMGKASGQSQPENSIASYFPVVFF